MLNDCIQYGQGVCPLRLVTETNTVANDILNSHFTVCGEGFAKIKLLIFDRVFGPDHGQADAGGFDQANGVMPGKAIYEGNEGIEWTFAEYIVNSCVWFHAGGFIDERWQNWGAYIRV